jgi:hypothetical protein
MPSVRSRPGWLGAVDRVHDPDVIRAGDGAGPDLFAEERVAGKGVRHGLHEQQFHRHHRPP